MPQPTFRLIHGEEMRTRNSTRAQNLINRYATALQFVAADVLAESPTSDSRQGWASNTISDTQGTPLETRNNIIVGNGSRNGETEVAGPFTNNYYNQPIGSVLFADTGAGDYSLLEESPALTVAQDGGVAGASSVALNILKKMYNHSLVWIPGRGNGPGGTGLPGDTA